jgi:hypothetical protein
MVPNTPGIPLHAGQAGQTNTLAVVSLLCGIGSFVAHIIPLVGPFTVALVAVITGYMARNQIRETGESGMSMATVGMVLGIAQIIFTVSVYVLFFLAIFAFGLTVFGFHRS